MSKRTPFLTVTLRGPAIKASRMRLDDFLLLGREISHSVDRVASVLTGLGDSRRAGRRPDQHKAAVSLDLVGFSEGSPAAVVEFDRSGDQQSLGLAVDLGAQAFERWLDGLDAPLSPGDGVPPGYDVGVLISMRDLGGLFDKGVSQIEFALTRRANPVRVAYDREKRNRLSALIAQPAVATRTIEGRLMMADFKASSSRIRIEPPVGGPIACSFDEPLREAVYDNILCFVRVTGIAQTDPVTRRITDLRLTDILRLDEPQLTLDAAAKERTVGLGDFWQPPGIEALAEAQHVSPVASLEDLMGGWPADEADDGFEVVVARWRTEEPRIDQN